MVTVEYFHFCGHAFWDSKGSPCLIGIFGSELLAPSFPLRMASLTIAIGVRVPPTEEATITLQLGPPGGNAEREWHLTVNGPPMEGPRDAVTFLPFRTVSLFLEKPVAIEARVIEKGQVLAAKTLHVVEAPDAVQSPIGPPAPDDPDH